MRRKFCFSLFLSWLSAGVVVSFHSLGDGDGGMDREWDGPTLKVRESTSGEERESGYTHKLACKCGRLDFQFLAPRRSLAFISSFSPEEGGNGDGMSMKKFCAYFAGASMWLLAFLLVWWSLICLSFTAIGFL